MPPTQLFSALADDVRCKIIVMLHKEPLPVHRLAEAFPISRPAISRHLRVLSEAGLVAERKRGRENIYALRPKRLNAAREWLEIFAAAAVTDPDRPPVEVAPVKKAAPKKRAAEKPATKPMAEAPAAAEQMGFDF